MREITGRREVLHGKQIYMTPKQPFFVTSSRSYEKFILNRFGIVHFTTALPVQNPDMRFRMDA
ncbi:MAG: hypothetical protein ACLR5S_10280 [Ruminococcus sp.]